MDFPSDFARVFYHTGLWTSRHPEYKVHITVLEGNRAYFPLCLTRRGSERNFQTAIYANMDADAVRGRLDECSRRLLSALDRGKVPPLSHVMR